MKDVQWTHVFAGPSTNECIINVRHVARRRDTGTNPIKQRNETTKAESIN